MLDLDQIRDEYPMSAALGERMRRCLLDQLSDIFGKQDITLGVPIESRVKSLTSIEEKIKRKSLTIKSVLELPDFVGLRIILLFQKDLEQVQHLIQKNLEIIEQEDTATRLESTQFGYQSRHFVIRLPHKWLAVPTYRELSGITAELQVRTLAQHIWAVASHKLQYKHEASVPLPLRRTISRVSAFLETVDLEFSRVLEERERYVVEDLAKTAPDDALNVDLLASVLDKMLPPKNKDTVESYDSLLKELAEENLNRRDQLEKAIEGSLDVTLKEDAQRVRDVLKNTDGYEPDEIERAERGVYYTHTGLLRVLLSYHRRLAK